MPSTVITLVFTDVVGSSAAKRAAGLGADLSERDRVYLDAIQTKHLRLVRHAVEEYRGKEIMTMGDGFFLTFDDPVDAVRCAGAIHQRLVSHPIDTLSGPLCLRIGIHAGTPKYFENSWHGTDVDMAARVQSVASPQQLLISDAARQVVGDPVGLDFRPLGTFTLKGVGPVKLWDVDYDGQGVRTAGLRSDEQRRHTRRLWGVIAGVMLLTALSLGSWFLWQEHRRTTAEAASTAAQAGTPTSIIVADFDNKTGDPVFDATLSKALSIQLQQSPVLAIVGEEHLRESVQYLGKSSNEPVTSDIAREIGAREGVKVYITGSIDKFGSSYLIEVSALKTATGDVIASEQAQAADKDHVIDALGTVATSLRTHLGESLASIQNLDTPLDEATTASLEAFQAFALGEAAHDAGRNIPDAEGHYKQALELDPNFAMAWARLGVVYGNSGQPGKALDYLTHAFDLLKNRKVSERERFYIESKYYNFVTGDVQKGLDTLELACRTYPLDPNYPSDLGYDQIVSGQLDAALVSLRMGMDLEPKNAVGRVLYLALLTQLDRYPEAQAVADESRQLGLDDTLGLGVLYDLHFLTGNTERMAQDAARAVGREDEFTMTANVAYSEEFEGRYAEANASWKHAAAQAARQNAKDTQATYIVERLSGRDVAGLDVEAAADLKAALALDQTAPTLENVAEAAASCDQPDIALPLLAELARKYPENTIINRLTIPRSRAELALNAHQPQEALTDLESTEAFGVDPWTSYLRGTAFLQLQDGVHALESFREAVKYRGANLLKGSQIYGQAQLGVARSYLLLGDKASAKRAYETFFKTWKNADADLPQLVAAKKEYTALGTLP